MSAVSETRWLGFEQCPNGDALHVLPVRITSSAPLLAVETPGNITDAEPCRFCCPPAPTKEATDDRA